MKYLALFLCALIVSGCAFKARKHTLFCVGVCTHAEVEVEKRGEPPRRPAPEPTTEADKG